MRGLEVIEVSGRERWRVVFRDSDRWQLGIYVPENEKLEDIEFLEKHDCPELFILVDGRVTLVLSDGDRLEEVEMEKGKAYVVEAWHNAYRPGGVHGIALVVERPDVKTEYRRLSSFRR